AAEVRAKPEGALAEVEIRPPTRIAVGRGNAFVLGGWCYHPASRTRGLSVRVGDSVQRVERFGLPRDDVHRMAGSSSPAAASAYRSGFVTLIDLAPGEASGSREIELILSLDDGSEAIAPLGSIEVLGELPAPADLPAPSFAEPRDRVAICMATYEPPPDLLRIQLDSIREQTHGNWLCLISDDASSEEGFRRLLEATEGDSRFVVSRSPERLGFYRNFERALSMTPSDADYVTLCDQDDRWHPGKLERLV